MKLESNHLSGRKMVLISFMLFSLFFGAGNLIFPPFLGQNAGNHTPVAFIGFMMTAVILPVLGVIVVAKFSGLENLGRLVGKKFALVFTLLIYLSIGPGLGIPRAASVPFEMAVAPYLPEDANLGLFMAIYSLVFFAIALWLCLTPGKLVKRIGSVLTPSLLTLILVLFISFLVKGETSVAPALGEYQDGAFLQGFVDGYQTMDAIAALNFGLVIAATLNSFGVTKKKSMLGHTIFAGIVAGSILTFVYFMLAYMGAQSSGVHTPDANGAVLLRYIVEQIFGTPGAILLAAIFTLACLTTCVGLINSISAYFAMLFTKVSYKAWAIIITVVSFLICNLGLNTILSISVPVLNIVYPISIMLIFYGLTNKLFAKFHLVYPITIAGVTVVSILHSLSEVFKFGAFGDFLNSLPLFEMGFFWIIVAAVLLVLTLIGYAIYYPTHKGKWALAGVTSEISPLAEAEGVLDKDENKREATQDAESCSPVDAEATIDVEAEATLEESMDANNADAEAEAITATEAEVATAEDTLDEDKID